MYIKSFLSNLQSFLLTEYSCRGGTDAKMGRIFIYSTGDSLCLSSKNRNGGWIWQSAIFKA